MRLQNLFLCICTAAIMLSSCKDDAHHLQDFKASDYDPIFSRKESVVPFPLFISYDELQALINRALPQELMNDTLFDGGKVANTKINLTRTGDIILTRKNNRLHLRVPIVANVEPRLSTKVLGIKLKASPAIKGSFFLNLSSTVDFNEAYQIIPDMHVDAVEWIDEPSVRLAGFDISITKAVEKMIAEKGPVMEKRLNQMVFETVNVRKPVTKIWSDMHKPVRINKLYKQVFLIPEPQGLKLSRIDLEEDGIIAHLELTAFISTFIGDDTTHTRPSELPVLLRADSTRNNFDLNFFISIPLADVSKILEDEITDKVMDVEGQQLLIKSLRIHTSPEKLLVTTKISQPANAFLRFESTVHFDPVDTSVAAHDFDFLVIEGDNLVHAADAFLHTTVLDAIGDEFKLKLGGLINELGPLVENAIDNGKLGEKISLRFNNVHMEPTEILLRPDTLLLNIHGIGEVELEILDLRKRKENAKPKPAS